MENDADRASGASFAAWRAEMAKEVRTLAALHAAEVDVEVIRRLGAANYPAESVLPIDDDDSRRAVDLMRQAVFELRDPTSQQIDELAVDYAAIYLTGALHLSPNESAWLDEDHLERQQPMFEVRNWYQRHGVRAADWRCRSEDNLSLQLTFIAMLLELEDQDAAMSEAATFMDQHLLRWLGDFGSGVAQRCSTKFYAALALYTHSVTVGLRAVVGELGGIPRFEIPASGGARPTGQQSDAAVQPMHYFPGAAPSW
ncbi:MAG: molecular chaperone TorD family protein [Sterolibacteriaceae bacterium]|uniref:Molecular chaperone TorD family protein n=1 Tax=Candidatus Methylophosphatis roskildensis TaxID=2899263 RepID=A0A9D7E284_9PROT|nr:molecular chaperone TorD family protein [Candidatus Methylophosphatis roskildensis]MBK7235146.1 molecular chaperone TorD family protein [Sterolibacteriaceae bacterium]